MKLDNISGFKTIDEYIRHKLDQYSAEEKTFATLFKYMFSETGNTMVEITDGYRIKKITYGEFKQMILSIVPTMKEKLGNLEKDSIVGIYMQNSIEWLEVFWAILACGFRPLLMNTRMQDETLGGILAEYNVSAVISDEKKFSVNTFTKDEITVPSEAPYEPSEFGSEVIFMSSGTTENVKLCAYTGENFYYQVCDSINIVEKCPSIKEHYEGELKQLTLLPFYHVFGFIAVYLWFAFFSRTFVFPRDLNPATIQNTVKKHKVTHIFAVPMVWEAVHKAVLSKVKAKGDRTFRKFNKMLRLVNKTNKLGDALAKRFLSEVREGLFGDSIRFLITGGSHINPETLKFFNGIGYHLANGYGMTEIGITSVEFSDNKKMLNSGTVGGPFGNTEYSLSEKGVLLVRGKTMASKITCGGVEQITDFDKWFETKDIAHVNGGRYFIDGRSDDLIVSDSGENLNPTIAERSIKVAGVDRLCVFADSSKNAILLMSIPGCFSTDALEDIYRKTLDCLKEAKLEGAIKSIYFTPEPLISGNDFKVSRKKIARKFESKAIKIVDPKNISQHIDELLSGLESEIRNCFAEALEKPADSIGLNDNFFTDLGGSSLDYFALLGILKAKFGIEFTANETERLSTVKDIFTHINKGEQK